jgi:hypothetical protein
MAAPLEPSSLALYRSLGVPDTALPRPPLEQDLGAADLPVLDLAGLEALIQLYRAQPEEVLARARLAFDRHLTADDLARVLESTRAALLAPPGVCAHLEVARGLGTSDPLPDTFSFEGMDLAEIPIDPGNIKFEERADWWGWVVNTGQFLFGYPAGAPEGFRFHDQSPSGFVYPLCGQAAGAELQVALFSDFGTGLYHSRYIAKQLRTRAFPYAIHLGDVYYAGRQEEFENYFISLLDPMLGATRLFTMNGNHEMFSRGVPFFRYIDARRASPLQEQEGSYFCLRGETAQIVAIDTDYFGYRGLREPCLVAWLKEQLEYGRRHGLTNILLTGDEPYEYGSLKLTPLLSDLGPLVQEGRLVDLWFWGNTHYCALFGAADTLPFIGSCIGHGGYPFGRQSLGRPSPAPVIFLETGARFPEWTNVRQDRGNNGYCVLTFQPDGGIGLRYVDWMARDRCLVSLTRAEDGRLAIGEASFRA